MPSSKPRSFRIVFFSSGEGQLFESTARALLKADFDIVGLVTQNPTAGCVARAKSLNVPVHYLNSSKLELQNSLQSVLYELEPEYIVLAGFTRKIPEDVVSSYEGRIINSHPSLLPKYGGKGMYGRFVHEAVLNSGDLNTGISVHIVTSNYDDGPVIAQTQLEVRPGEKVEELENRVKILEREFLPKALMDWLSKQ